MTSEPTKAMDDLIAQDADLIDPVQDRLVLAVRELAADDSQCVAEAFAETLRKALAMHGLVAEKADRIEALTAENERLLEAMKDPNVVHVNMLRGGIAKPSVGQILHIYGEDVFRAALEGRQ